MGQESGDLLFAHFLGVTFTVKENEAADPLGIGLFSPPAVVLHSQMPPDAVEQLWWRGGGERGRGKAHEVGTMRLRVSKQDFKGQPKSCGWDSRRFTTR